MNFLLNKSMSFLNADEASAIETAVRSILEVFCGVNEKRSHCYEAKLAEAERENTALRSQLKAAEQELQTLRQISSNYQISADVTLSADVQETGRVPASFRNVPEDSSAVPGLKEEEDYYESKLFIKSEMTEQDSALHFRHPVIENVQICQQTARIQSHGTQNDNNYSVNQEPVLTGSERSMRAPCPSSAVLDAFNPEAR